MTIYTVTSINASDGHHIYVDDTTKVFMTKEKAESYFMKLHKNYSDKDWKPSIIHAGKETYFSVYYGNNETQRVTLTRNVVRTKQQ